MVLKVAFSIDDIAPSPGFGLFKEHDALKWAIKLHEEFGCKFTLFVIPMKDGTDGTNIQKHKAWVDWLNKHPAFEIAQHGLTHKAKQPELEAQEFANMPLDEVYARIVNGKKVFHSMGVNVVGFKSPGWTQPKEIYPMLESLGFEYVADHFIGSKPIMVGQLRRLPYTLSIESLHSDKYKDDYLVLHSHIHPGDGRTLNAWNEKLYNDVREYLISLQKNINVEYVFMKDMK